MPRDYAVEAQRTAILRDELARTRARLDQAVRAREDLAVRVDELLGFLIRRRALSESAARRLLRDLEAADRP
jgi:hypothetical protein